MLTIKILNKFSPEIVCMIGIIVGRKGEVNYNGSVIHSSAPLSTPG